MTPWTVAYQRLCPWNSPGKNTGVGSHSLLQGIFPTQGSNSGLCITGLFFNVWATRKPSLLYLVSIMCFSYKCIHLRKFHSHTITLSSHKKIVGYKILCISILCLYIYINAYIHMYTFWHICLYIHSIYTILLAVWLTDYGIRRGRSIWSGNFSSFYAPSTAWIFDIDHILLLY